MEQSEIIKGNMLLAQIMGYELVDEYTLRCGPEFKFTIDRGKLIYHCDWNEFMLVYNKFLKLYSLNEMLRNKMNANAFIRATFSSMLRHSDINGEVNIQSNWLKMVDIARWYFENKFSH